MNFDMWTIEDADPKWNFLIRVEPDPDTGRPELYADAYNPEFHEKEGEPESAEWARQAIKAWERDDWHWVVLFVTPILKDSEVIFDGATQTLGAVEYGFIPDGSASGGTWTSAREYLRSSYLDDLMKEAKGSASEAMRAMAGAA